MLNSIIACGYNLINRRRMIREERALHSCSLCCFNNDVFTTRTTCRLSFYCDDGYFRESLGVEPDQDKVDTILKIASLHI